MHSIRFNLLDNGTFDVAFSYEIEDYPMPDTVNR